MFFYGIRASYYAFTGKKYNPLRDRVDEADIGFRHRLFATFEFLLLAFLTPTIVVFCSVFSGVSADLTIDGKNYFQLFILVLSIGEISVFITKLYVKFLSGSYSSLKNE